MKRDIIEADFEVVGEPPYEPLRIPWGAVFWFCVYAGAFGYAAAMIDDRWSRGIIAFLAALIVPFARWTSSIAQMVSEREARQLRRRLRGRE